MSPGQANKSQIQYSSQDREDAYLGAGKGVRGRLRERVAELMASVALEGSRSAAVNEMSWSAIGTLPREHRDNNGVRARSELQWG